ncbi:MAG: KH domain-containing protein [Nitrospira sp.]|nr:KH domain-containing protein [Nitrospira sp.]
MEASALAEYIVKALVDYPEQVVAREIKGIGTTILELEVHKADIGKVIGKKGVTISALRTILSAAAAKEKRNIVLELIE